MTGPLTIARIHAREIRMNLRERFRISSGVSRTRRILLVETRNDEGERGWGECVAGTFPNYSSETVDTAWLALRRWVAPVVLGRSFPDARSLGMALASAFRGHTMAKASVEMAVWDLEARRRHQPLAALLGGTRERIATGISLGIQPDPAALATRARTALSEGYRRIKLKIAPGADVGFVRAVRDALGPDAPVMVDANAAYTPADTDHLRRLDDFGLMMIEQPLAAGDLVRHAALQRVLATPLCLDESITDPDRAEDMLTLDSGRIINIKAGRVGGHAAALAIHDLARARAVPVWCGGMLETGIGRAHNVALASLPGFTIPGDVSPSARYWDRDIVTPGWTMTDGTIAVPRDRPGIGVDVDEEFVDRLTVRQETLTEDDVRETPGGEGT